ncbi:MAG: hypothetical protein IAE89_15390 [Anaerolineae bacterium]|nr:hypothetical protein [Anaerolineae bacterium]
MYDRPDVSELIDAVRQHLERQVIPAIKGDAKLYFQTLVAANVLKIALRDLALSGDHLQSAWERLNDLHGEIILIPANQQEAVMEMQARNRSLCTTVRAGEWDAPDHMNALIVMALANTVDALAAANPKFLTAIQEELQQRS